MSEIVYGDLLFLINFSMDFLCFYITAFLLHTKLPLLRASVSSSVGGVYAVAVLFINTGQFFALLLDVLCCVLMCVIVFYKKRLGAFGYLKAVGVYFLVSMLLGGIMTGLFSLFNRVKFLSDNYGVGEGLSVWIFALLASVSALCTFFGSNLFKRKSKEKTVELTFDFNGEETTLTALVDSGNLVCDPISQRAVAIVALDAVRGVVPKEMLPAFESVSALEGLDSTAAGRLRIIPSGTVLGGGVMLALKPKSVFVGRGEKRLQKDILIAIVNRESFGAYFAIVPEEILV